MARIKRVLESFGQFFERMSLLPAVDGKNRPFIGPHTQTKEAHPKMSLWTVCIVMHHGKSTKERGKVQLNEEDPDGLQL